MPRTSYRKLHTAHIILNDTKITEDITENTLKKYKRKTNNCCNCPQKMCEIPKTIIYFVGPKERTIVGCMVLQFCLPKKLHKI